VRDPLRPTCPPTQCATARISHHLQYCTPCGCPFIHAPSIHKYMLSRCRCPRRLRLATPHGTPACTQHSNEDRHRMLHDRQALSDGTGGAIPFAANTLKSYNPDDCQINSCSTRRTTPTMTRNGKLPLCRTGATTSTTNPQPHQHARRCTVPMIERPRHTFHHRSSALDLPLSHSSTAHTASFARASAI